MAKIPNQFLVFLLVIIFASSNAFGNDSFEGIWRSANNNNPEMDSYIGIEKVGDNEYFVIHLDPYNEHQFDYAKYGYIDDQGYLVIDLGETIYYIESYDEMSLYHNWNFREDMNAYLFKKVLDSTFVEEETVISPEDFQLFIQEAIKLREENSK